jgi:PilZ domain
LETFSRYSARMTELDVTAESDSQSSSREQIRESIFLGATLTFERNDDVCPARVRNISAGGIMVDCTVFAQIGDRVSAEIKNIGVVHGTVAWIVEPRMGIAFDHEIDPAKARVKI